MSTVEIPLSRGYVAVVDAEDADRVLAFKWYAVPHGRTVYARRNLRKSDGKRTTLLLHKFLTGYASTDHANGNGLDNRRSNLRDSGRSENMRNQRMRRDNKSGFKGIHWNKRSSKWQAQIGAEGLKRGLGYYVTAEEAARAYDAAARELHGEHATVNFPQPGERAA